MRAARLALASLLAVASCAVEVEVDRAAHALHGAPPTLTRLAPDGDTVVAARDERIGFVASGSDPNGDLWGVEWYLDGAFLGAQHDAAPFWRGINFPANGSYYVEAIAFDRAGHYSAPVAWTVTVEERPRALYVSDAPSLLGAAGAVERARLLAFAEERGFDTLILYGVDNFLRGISGDPGSTPAWCPPAPASDPRAPLGALITEARERGIARVYVAVGASAGTVRAKVNAIERFNCELPGFDGAVTEHEFWNGEPWSVFQELVDRLRDVGTRRPFETSVYLGARRLPAWQRDWITERADRILLTAYVDAPEEAFGHLEERLRNLARLPRATEVWVIYSAEEEHEQRQRCMDESTDFMGDWLGTYRHVNPLHRAEHAVTTSFRDAGGAWRNGVRVTGFAYFRYDFLRDYLEHGPSTARNRPPALCATGARAIELRAGQSFTFWADGWDEDGNLSGTEWYGWNRPGVAYHSAGNPGVQYVSGTDGGTGTEATFGRRYQFVTPGRYTITALGFDTALAYDEPVVWDVRVE